FQDGKPVMIDTLSFDIWRGGAWAGYRQFCQHFLAPLTLMAKVDARLGRLLQTNLDGVPLDMASRLLPAATYLDPSTLIHVHLHSNAMKRFSDRQVKGRRMGKDSLLGLVDSLESAVKRLRLRADRTPWTSYYGERYGDGGKSLDWKKAVVAGYIAESRPTDVWDIGGNVGAFSRLATEKGIPTTLFDADHACVEQCYLEAKARTERNLLPLVVDVTNPSPASGWANEERASLTGRGPADLVIALALTHHLAITDNIPFRMIADYFSRICRKLIVEFVPKDDPNVQRMLASREDVFPEYGIDGFEAEFGRRFTTLRKERNPGTGRTIYLMVKR
ncbi:MAG: SAM-dependent methyltransferase, partial [Candidatus Altiarchaeota archaeon]